MSRRSGPEGPVEGMVRLEILGEALRAEDDAWGRAEGMAPGSFTRVACAVPSRNPAVTPDSIPGPARRPSRSTTTGRSRTTRSRAAGGIVELAIGAPEAILDLASVPDDVRAAWHERLEVACASTASGWSLSPVEPTADRWALER